MLAHGFELSWLAVPLGILLGVSTLLLTGPRWQFAGAPHRRVATGAIIATATCAGVAYAAALDSEAGDAKALSGLGTLILLLALIAFAKAGAKQ